MTARNLSLEKTTVLLREIAAARGQSPLTELAARSGLPMSTAHRLVSALEGLGLVVREKRGHYHIGPVIAALAEGYDGRALMARIARPLMKRLARRFAMTVHLAVFEGDMVTYVAKENAGSTVHTVEGAQLEAYCSGLGKALLAHLAPAELDRYLNEGPFVRLTARTITDPDVLRAELALVRTRGYALDDREVYEALKCVAVPVRGGDDRVFAALSLSGAADDFTDARVEEARTALAEDARAIGHTLHPAGPVSATG